MCTDTQAKILLREVEKYCQVFHLLQSGNIHIGTKQSYYIVDLSISDHPDPRTYVGDLIRNQRFINILWRVEHAGMRCTVWGNDIATVTHYNNAYVCPSFCSSTVINNRSHRQFMQHLETDGVFVLVRIRDTVGVMYVKDLSGRIANHRVVSARLFPHLFGEE